MNLPLIKLTKSMVSLNWFKKRLRPSIPKFLALRFFFFHLLSPQIPSLSTFLPFFFILSSLFSQVTVDVAWSPNCIDGRCYDYAGIPLSLLSYPQKLFFSFSLPYPTLGLANASDFVFVMDYDMRSQIPGFFSLPLPILECIF